MYSLLGEGSSGLIPVGRLDQDSTGLLLLTTDHRLADGLTNPSAGVEKTYRVLLDRPVREAATKALARGVEIDLAGRTYRTKPARVSLLSDPMAVEVTIKEGKNRQIRRMFESIGYDVRSLHRVALGGLALGELKEGEYRELTREEVTALKAQIRSSSS